MSTEGKQSAFQDQYESAVYQTALINGEGGTSVGADRAALA
jgi:hypothetical protein